MIFSVDPSSLSTGFAVVTLSGILHACGVIKPDSARSHPYKRIRTICDHVWESLDEYTPSVILLEWSTGKVGHRRHRGGGSGLAVYGEAVGAIANQCWTWADINNTEFVPVDENVWTRGMPKEARAKVIAARYPNYSAIVDPGLDAADAIGLADWYLTERRIMKL